MRSGVDLLTASAGRLLRSNAYYVLAVAFLHYVVLRLRRLRAPVRIRSLPDEVFRGIVERHFDVGGYVDASCCAFGRADTVEGRSGWVNFCCCESTRKYRVQLLSLNDEDADDGDRNVVYVSETALFNVESALGCVDHSKYFVLPAQREPQHFADEVKISMICSPHDCPNDLIDTALKNYFSNPRYLRQNDVITVDIKNYAPGLFCTLPSPQLRSLHFKVNVVRVSGERTLKPCYAFQGATALIQEGKIHHYLPRNFTLPLCDAGKSTIDEEIQRGSVEHCPKFLEKYVTELASCILPFISSDDWMGLRPVFLVEGPRGSGKHHLVNSLSKRLGLNLLNVDCSEVQSLSPSQTEAKLRITFSNAEAAVPCVLKLSNIQIFGRNAEGKLDERVTSNFSHQLSELYAKRTRYPLITVATSEAAEIPAELNRNFIEKVQINYPTQEERTDLLSWYLKIQKIDHDVDLLKISGTCSDFLMSDVRALTQNAVKRRYVISGDSKLREEDFEESYRSMQLIFSDEIGAPRIPEVHWEDIGGLASLKREIIRRIEIPLMENSGIQSSGILLYGPPGTGKTLLAKAVATECKLNFLSVKGPELLNMYVGQSEKNVRDVFERARSASPCIVFFDELDALAPNRGRSGDSGGVMDRVVSQLLAEMDGLGSATTTFVIGATNRPDLIDPALLRPGRFDKLLYVGIYADRDSQLSVLRAITRRFSLEGDNVLEEIVDQLPSNLTGADLQALCSDAWLNAAKRVIRNYESSGEDSRPKKPDGVVAVSTEDFVQAAGSLVPSVSREELRRYEKLHGELTSRK